MPVQYYIVDDCNLVVVDYRGTITTEEIVEAFYDYHSSDRHDPFHQFLVDMSHVEEINVDFTHMLTMISRLGPFQKLRAPGVRTAFHAPDDLTFGVSRMYQSLARGSVKFEIGVFRAPQQAADFVCADLQKVRAALPEAARF